MRHFESFSTNVQHNFSDTFIIMYYISETTLIPDSNLGEYNLSESFCNLVLKTLSSSFSETQSGKVEVLAKIRLSRRAKARSFKCIEAVFLRQRSHYNISMVSTYIFMEAETFQLFYKHIFFSLHYYYLTFSRFEVEMRLISNYAH